MLRTLFQILAFAAMAAANLWIGGVVEFGGEFTWPFDKAKGEPNGLGADPVIDKQSLQDRRNDPVYKKNLQRLIERNRMFEESRNEQRS